MAISDGDPRTLVPDFLSSFNWFERNQTVRFYAQRHASTGKNYPADEAPASVARRALVLGVYAANLALATTLWAALIAVNLFLPDSLYLNALALVGVGLAVVALAALVAWTKHRRINRYFDEHFPGSLDFRNGTTSAES